MISTSILPGETFSLFHFGAGTIKLEIACNGAAQSVTQMRMMILMIMIILMTIMMIILDHLWQEETPPPIKHGSRPGDFQARVTGAALNWTFLNIV